MIINKLFSCFHNHVERIDQNYGPIVKHFNKLAEGMYTIQKDMVNFSNEKTTNSIAVDTKLGVATGYELFKLKRYIVLLDDEDSTHKRIKYSIKRLEESFHDRGFRMEEYEGEEYQIEKNLKVVSRIEDETLLEGKKIISRMLKPTIFYKDKVYKIGEIELKIGTKKNRSKNV